MKSIYTSLNYQKMMYEKQLIEKKRELQDIKVEKQNIIIKKIHGELYYYAQYRKEGKVKSKYLSPVIPGKIADVEKTQNTIARLSKEIRDLEWNIESLEKMLTCYKKERKKSRLWMNFLLKCIGRMKLQQEFT